MVGGERMDADSIIDLANSYRLIHDDDKELGSALDTIRRMSIDDLVQIAQNIGPFDAAFQDRVCNVIEDAVAIARAKSLANLLVQDPDIDNDGIIEHIRRCFPRTYNLLIASPVLINESRAADPNCQRILLLASIFIICAARRDWKNFDPDDLTGELARMRSTYRSGKYSPGYVSG